LIKSLLIAISLLLSVGCANAKDQANDHGAIREAEPSPLVAGSTYRERYALEDAHQKLVSNEGKGFEQLWGLRNVRAVLSGVYYRGGANNTYFKPKRNNMNPIPTEGLENMCKEGFTQAVYLYPTNYKTAPAEVKCRTFEGNENTLTYSQISPLAYREQDIRRIHSMIYDRVRNPHLGPMYAHCWNGWHAAGYVAATALRQFCGFTGDQAVDYWNLNTDGNHDGSYYNTLRAHIRSFEPSPDMTLTEEERTTLCPDPTSLKFQN
jgi:hypothetical protein